MFHTPPIKSSFTTAEATLHSYEHPLTIESPADDSGTAYTEDSPRHLPRELKELVGLFLQDVQTPKYTKPLTAQQLSETFQEFYTTFHARAELFVKGSVYYKQRVSKQELLSAKEQQEKKAALEQIEHRIVQYCQLCEEEVCTALFDKLLNKFLEDVEMNDHIKRKLALLKRVKDMDYCKFLDVQMKLTPELDLISHQLEQLSFLKTPLEKLEVLQSIHAAINTTLLQQISRVDGDYFLPILIYLIMVNEDNVDFYLNLNYIKRFRNHALLIEESLYCLTNFEAALMYIQTLELPDDYDFSNLTPEERVFLQKDTSMELSLPSVSTLHPPVQPMVTRSIGSAFDTGIKSMMNRFSSPLPDNTESGSTIDDSFNPLNRLAGVMKWRSTDKTPQLSPSSSPSTFTGRVRSRTNSLQQRVRSQLNLDHTVDLNKYKGKSFDDMTMGELKDMFHDYQTLLNQLK